MMKRPASYSTNACKRTKASNMAISKPMKEWRVEDVLAWLRAQDFPETLCVVFSDNRIDGETLISLTEQDLKQELRISALGDRRKLIKRRDECLDSPESTPVVVPPAEPVGRNMDSTSLESPPAQVQAMGAAKSVKPEPLQSMSSNTANSCVASDGGSFSNKVLSRPAVYPSLPNGRSKRQRLHCEILDTESLQREFGYGGPITPNCEEQTEHTESVKTRIRKMLDMAFHPATPEAEKAQALRNAQRLMQQHAVNEVDLRTQIESPQGGLFAAKVTWIGRSARVQKEKWMLTLSSAVTMLFDTACYTRHEGHALCFAFYGRSEAAEAAAYAFACASNLMLWMAGSRALPSDRTFTFGAKHRGAKFSAVLRGDPGYVAWAKNTEYDGAGECLQNFIEYVRAHEEPAEWDRAYLEGMAQTLLSKTRSTCEHQNVDSLALRSRDIQDEVLRHFGVTVKSSKGKNIAAAHGLRKARSSGSSDAAGVHLGQRQIQQPSCLAIEH